MVDYEKLERRINNDLDAIKLDVGLIKGKLETFDQVDKEALYVKLGGMLEVAHYAVMVTSNAVYEYVCAKRKAEKEAKDREKDDESISG